MVNVRINNGGARESDGFWIILTGEKGLSGLGVGVVGIVFRSALYSVKNIVV